jgi:cytochrome c oxidase cbb3-type subunit 3
MRLIFALFCTTVLGVGLYAQTPANPKTLKNPIPADAKSIEAGKATFTKSCVVCHGATAKGDGAIVKSLKPEATKPSDLTDAKWDHGSTDGEIFTNIREGIGPKFEMKAQKGKLMDNDIWNVVNYLKSLGPKK